MSFYFREKPRFGEKLRGKSGDELMQELKQQFDDDKSFFDQPTTRNSRDPFERHTSFSRGFPFEDSDGFGRRSSDIRSHLDDLAARHPELADHLLGSAWGDIPAFHNTGSLRNRRRRDSGNSSAYQGHPEDDARSQTSGSSAASAASGASAASSSHGEPFSSERQESTQDRRRTPISQYNLRNTVDIGQHRHDMDNERMNDARGQRSMSAPPENRQQSEASVPIREKQSEQQNSQNPNQRFVSRVDITPQFVQPGATSEKPATNQQKPQQQSNVRHIPIFVEGRDEPVIPKNIDHDESDSPSWGYTKPTRTESPPHFTHNSQFQTPPQFHRPSHFNQHYAGGRPRDWFDEEVYAPQGSSFYHPSMRRHQQPFASQSPPRQQQQHFRQQNEKPFYNQRSSQQQQAPQQPQQPQQPPQPPQQPQQQQQPPAEPPRKQTQPKDPLQKVAEVQQEVDSLHEQVVQWNGKSRKDKDYMYLDEMLTRELIKLDDIETEGKENVRQARKNTIKSIQASISLLESKAPTGEQQESQETMEVQQETTESAENVETPAETEQTLEVSQVENSEQQQTSEPSQEPSSPTKDPAPVLPEASDATEELVAQTENIVVDENNSTSQQDNEMDVAPSIAKVSSVGAMEVQPSTDTEQQTMAAESVPVEAPVTSMEVEAPAQTKSPKKARKTKKQQQQQQAVSESAIPLPAPGTQ